MDWRNRPLPAQPEDTERERAPRWLKLKDKHSEVESNINSLEQHGLDRCPDKGLHGYKRYAGLGVLAYNLHRIGKGLLEQAAGSKTRGRKKKAAQQGIETEVGIKITQQKRLTP